MRLTMLIGHGASDGSQLAAMISGPLSVSASQRPGVCSRRGNTN